MVNEEGTSGTGVHGFEQVFDSNLESVDTAEAVVVREATEAGFSEDDVHRIGIAARECLVNAVVHGNRYSAKKKVHLKVERTENGITIWVGDEGEGFDPAEVPDPLHNENLLKHSGRGVMLMQAFMDEFHVRARQPRGTEVKLSKRKTQTS